jgi:hypothetical protein
VLTRSKRLDDESKTDESNEDDIELAEAGEDAAESFEPPEEPLALMALAVEGLVIWSGLQAIALERHPRDEAKIQGQVPGLVVLVSAVHHQMQRRGPRANAAPQLAARLGVGRLTVQSAPLASLLGYIQNRV